MGIITTGAFAKALWPGVKNWYGKAYAEHSVEYTDLVDTYTDTRAWVEDVGITSFGLPAVKPEGNAYTYDSERQGFITRYTHVVYALGFIVTREALEDDQYDVIAQKRAQGLAFSFRQGKENVVANIYNRAFTGTYTGGDGLELCSTAHVNVAGGTWQNELTTAADLSEAALEQACIDIMNWTNDRGLKISVMPQSLIIPPALVFEAERILKTPYRVGTADNDINALNSMGKFQKGVRVNHYLTDTDAWFIRTNAPDGLKLFQRRKMQFGVDNDFSTENALFKGSERYSVGWTDPRAIYGSPGA